ncbi:MAG: RNB domain-containing ribonuclease [Lactobacillales bacterium]|nr:RNB domain-containing ribonuclease [Lactobacillales bacterium]
MVKKEKIRLLLKENRLEEINNFNKNSIQNILIELLEEEINDFDYDKDIEYIKNIMKILPEYINNKKILNEKLNIIHQSIKTYLVQKPGNIEKTNENYKILKSVINEIELIQMSILYDYSFKYEESKYKLIDYIIFDVKNIANIKDAIKRFPHIVNYMDVDNKSLILKVIEKYIEEVKNYTKEKEIDDIIYYEEVIDILMSSERFIFDVIDKQTLLKKIKEELKNVEEEKYRKTFYLNMLVEKIEGNQIKQDNSYLEYKYNIKTYFNEAIKSEVRSIIKNYHGSKDRIEIEDYILTFDGEGAKEIDDALSIKILANGNYELGVHIADPLSLIDRNSIIFDEASKRTTSIYLEDKTYSMFPIELSGDLLSLQEGKYRNATSYYFEVDKDGNLINYKFYKSIIKVNRNMSYNDFNKIILSGKNDSQLTKTITNLSNISNLLRQYYNEDELYSTLNRKENSTVNMDIIGLSSGEKVIESAMIFTNSMVARYFKQNNLPFIFRNHVIDQNMLNELDRIKQNILLEEDAESYLKYIEMVKTIYPKALYGVECIGHYGLGIDYYAHVTSPLRRFSDIVANICLEELYFNEYNKEKIEDVKRMILKHSNKINNKRSSIEKFSIKCDQR